MREEATEDDAVFSWCLAAVVGLICLKQVLLIDSHLFTDGTSLATKSTHCPGRLPTKYLSHQSAVKTQSP